MEPKPVFGTRTPQEWYHSLSPSLPSSSLAPELLFSVHSGVQEGPGFRTKLVTETPRFHLGVLGPVLPC